MMKKQMIHRGYPTHSNKMFSCLVLGVVMIAQTITLQAQPRNFERSGLPGLLKSSELAAQADDSAPKKVIVGSWIETVTFSDPGAPPPLKSLVTFSADGTTTVADQGNVSLAAGTVFSAGHGSWIALGDRTFQWTTVELVSDLNGNLVGKLKVRGTYTVDDTGNSYTGTFKADLEIYGSVSSFEGTNAGQRIEVEV